MHKANCSKETFPIITKDRIFQKKKNIPSSSNAKGSLSCKGCLAETN
ncbi:Uncharacterised protein [Segatella copri]|nr:Uncharacterised protein [Segatella copri]